MLIPARRIVTENTPEGRSRILSDAPTPHVVETAPERGLSDLWATFGPIPDLATPDGAARPVTLAPASGGVVFRYFQLPPAGQMAAHHGGESGEQAVFDRMGGGAARVAGARHPAMHRTETLDFIVLLKGRVKLILDEDETVLEPFDVVIQRRTNHAWENLSDEPALLIAVLMDAPGGDATEQ